MSEVIERHEDEGTKSFDPHLTRRLLRYLYPYRWRATFSVFLVIVSSLVELIGPAVIAIGIDLFVLPPQQGQLVGVSSRVGEWMAANGWQLDPMTGINIAALLYLLTLVGGFAALYTQMILMNVMGQYIMYDLRKQIFGHLQRLEVQFFDRNPVGRLMTRVTTDVDALNELFTAGFVAIFGDIFVLLGIVGMLFWLNWKLALVLFSITPFIVVVSIWFRRGARITYRAVRARIAAINAFLQEHISGMATVQLFNREEREAAKFDELNSRHRDANIDSIFYYAVFYPVIELIQTIGIALIVWYGGGEVIRGTMSLGVLVAFFQYAQRFYEPISDLSEKYNILQAAMAASERIFKLLDTPVEIASPAAAHRPVAVAGPPAGTAAPAPPRPRVVRGAIELDHVWFEYNPGEPVLRDVSFRVEPGQSVAVVGHTGAGKSTLASLILRFYDVTRGAVRVDGVDVREWDLATLRRSVALVLQDVFLFAGSLEQNVTLGDSAISHQRLRWAAAEAQALDFVQRLPRGFETEVQERGAGLSVGQKQLVSFARALAFDPAILMLDEATSS